MVGREMALEINKRRVLVTGANGQLGRALQALGRHDWEVFAFPSTDLDITKLNDVLSTFSSVRPDLVIHAAAATNVDRCEREPDWAYAINALGTRWIARATAAMDAELVYVSTNYVFDGSKGEPYHEFDQPRPISVYGASKLAGEQEAMAATRSCYVVRTASVFDRDGRNFVNTMRDLMGRLDRITVVNDQFSSPTYASDLAAAIGEIIDHAPHGTYHVTNYGTASWHEWAVEIKRLIDAPTDVAAITAADYQRDATPPANGVMRSYALEHLGIRLPGWQDALARCLAS